VNPKHFYRPLSGLALALIASAGPVMAATIQVSATCTLADAIQAADTNMPVGGCPAGDPRGLVGGEPIGEPLSDQGDTILLPPGSVQTLTAVVDRTILGHPVGLPLIDQDAAMTIDGRGSTIIRADDAPPFAIFGIVNRTLNLRNVSLVNGGSETVVVLNGSVYLTDSSISGGAGDGIHALESVVELQESTIADNAGAGIQGVADNIMRVLTSTLSGNRFGIQSENDFEVLVRDSTVTRNTLVGLILEATPLTLAQTLIAGNERAEVQTIRVDPSNILVGNFNLFGFEGDARVSGFTPGITDIVPTVPINAILSLALADNGGSTETHALVSESPAIDAVSDRSCGPLHTDQRGVPRQDGNGDGVSACDIGAFEYIEQ
jgi:hypothetical protein